jgi:hypothetical protein
MPDGKLAVMSRGSNAVDVRSGPDAIHATAVVGCPTNRPSPANEREEVRERSRLGLV